MKRVVAIVVGALAALTLLPAANAAAGYPPQSPELGASSSNPPPGGTVTLTASGFCPGGTVTFTLDPGGTVLGTATADGDGNAVLVITAPSTPGAYTVTATDTQCEASASLALNVSAAGGIPTTGSDSSDTMQWAGIAVLLGAGLIGGAAIARRRHATA